MAPPVTGFARRIRVSQRSLELLCLAILCSVLTSLLFAAMLRVGLSELPRGRVTLYAIGVVLVNSTLGLE